MADSFIFVRRSTLALSVAAIMLSTAPAVSQAQSGAAASSSGSNSGPRASQQNSGDHRGAAPNPNEPVREMTEAERQAHKARIRQGGH